MSSRAILPVTVDSTGQQRSPTAPPIHQERFTEASVASPQLLSQQLTRMVKSIDDATRPSRAHPAAKSRTFEDVRVPGGGAQFTLTHGLGHAVKWRVVDWHSSAAGVSLVRVATDGDTITWASAVAGIAAIEVY